jgi:hypothetical protein
MNGAFWILKVADSRSPAFPIKAPRWGALHQRLSLAGRPSFAQPNNASAVTTAAGKGQFVSLPCLLLTPPRQRRVPRRHQRDDQGALMFISRNGLRFRER